MAKVGLLTFSDGRDFVNDDLSPYALESHRRVAGALEAGGHDVVSASEIVWTNEIAVTQARAVGAQRPAATVFNYPVWAFPHFTMLAADSTLGPLVLFSNLEPAYPGMVGMLAAGGALDQIGRRHVRAWGDVGEPEVRSSLLAPLRAADAVSKLHGSTFGRVGGRPMGMYTAVADSDQWMRQFGIDVEEIDQWEIVRLSEGIPVAQVQSARKWLESHAGGVHYDGKRLTPEILERQISSYYAMRQLIEAYRLDFSGIKGQPELTNSFATMDVTEAFLNDPYDWDGPKETHVCATEADMDGALTMQILKHLSGTPVLFADVRHYHRARDVWDLCNSGQHATWFAARSDDPAENMANVHLRPEIFYFPAGGAAVQHVAAPGDCTLARLTRLDGEYRMQVTKGFFQRYSDEVNEDLMRQSTYEWPHAFTRIEASESEFLAKFGANHIHAVPGDHMDDLRAVSELLGIRFESLAGVGGSPRDGHAGRPPATRSLT
ncbi:MAG: L-fucose/L-arabinose isomerase family protein [Actinomycetota bacterium]|nr:L-fucose/L-arabinose isomerase family protein [Actinomycetota bacterium]